VPIVYRDACIGLTDVSKGMWGAAENAFLAASTGADAAISSGDLSQYAAAQGFAALAEDVAQVSLAQLQGTSDAKALAQYKADAPLYSQYFVGCS
jgi:precorrin-3B methylase